MVICMNTNHHANSNLVYVAMATRFEKVREGTIRVPKTQSHVHFAHANFTLFHVHFAHE